MLKEFEIPTLSKYTNYQPVSLVKIQMKVYMDSEIIQKYQGFPLGNNWVLVIFKYIMNTWDNYYVLAFVSTATF